MNRKRSRSRWAEILGHDTEISGHVGPKYPPEIKARLKDMEFEIVASSPQEFSNWISTEIVRWGKVIKDTGAKVN